MKNIILAIFVMVSQIIYSQVTINLGDFDTVKVFDQLNVILVAGDENKIVVTGKNENNLETVNKNGVLKIRMKLTSILSGDKTKATLYFKNLRTIDANEGSIVSTKHTFKQTSVDLSAQEGALIEVDVDVENTIIKANSGGIINISGRSTTHKATITSGGILNSKNLETSQTAVSIVAGGSAEVNASILVDAKVKAGGSVSIYGKPKEIKQETFAGGTIIEK